MRKLLALFLVLLSIKSYAIDYYISNSGNDATNNGTSPSTPWATIAKLNSSWGSINSGDRIYFQRGGVFFGTIAVGKSGITLGAYGTGNLPVIAGYFTPTSWTSAGTNLWSTTIPGGLNNVRLLTINDKVTRVGRFPNYSEDMSAWFRYSNTLTATTPVTVIKEIRQSSDPANWNTAIPTTHVGGELVLFKNNWNLDVMPITAISGNNITCTNPAGLYGIAANPYYGNWGFFIQNTLAALDVPTEWHYNNSTKVLTMFSSVNPSTLGVIKFPVLQNLITLGSTSNITIDGLDLCGASEKGIISNGGSNITIRNTTVRQVQGWAMDLRSNGLLVEDNFIRDIGSNGIFCTGSSTVRRNTLKSVGYPEGMAGLTNSGAGTQGNQDDQHTGIMFNTSNGSNCFENRLDSIGHNGIRYYGSNITIERNVIKYVCITKGDGGAIYAWDENTLPAQRSNRLVKKNIMLYSNKALWGNGYSYLITGAYGLYFDGGCNNVVADSNVVAYSIYGPNSVCSTPTVPQQTDDAAIQIGGAFNITLRNTIVFGWPQCILINNWRTIPPPTGLRITNNALYARGTNYNANDACTYNYSLLYIDQTSSTGADVQNQIRTMGVVDSNYVMDPYYAYRYGSYSYNSGGLNIPAWRTASLQSPKDTSFPSLNADFQYNETGTPRVYTFSGLSKKDFKGVVYNNSATIPPYYANIFFPNGPATGTSLAAFSTASQINCTGGTATVTVTATGGVPPYSGTGNFTVTAGTYTYTVTDFATPTPNSITTTITVTQPPVLSATSSKTNVLCNGGSTGTINVVASGGTPNYTYNWGGGVTTQNRTALPIGTYTCTITDSKGCTTTTSQTISQPTALSAGTPTAPAISVNGGTTTITQPVPTGGTSPYQYQLNTGAFQTSNVFPNVPAGNYTINIKDANNCTIARTISIAQPTVFTATASAGTIACNGGSTNVVVSATGGTAPYTGTGTFSRTAGTYVFTVTDAGGATASANVVITQPTVITSTVASTNVTCNGASSGSITLTVNGGTPGYTYLWNGGQTTQNRTAIPAGTYTVTVTDANACTLNRSVTITEPTALSVTSSVNPTNILCNGGTSSVTIGASGGTSPYTGLGTFPQSAGTVTYIVTDANGCPASRAITLTQPTVLTASNPTSGTITVNGGNTTITQPIPTGGVSPYTYSLNTGAFQSSNVFTGVAAGTYTVNIKDANGCTITKSISITQPAVFSASAVQTGPTINCNGQNTIVTVSATGGTAPYTGTGTFTVPAGPYNYTVTDALGNTASASITISQPTQVVASIAAGSITSVGGTTNIVVSATGGVLPYTGTGTFTRGAGLYAFTVTDSNGCSSVATVSINDPVVIPNQYLILNSVFKNGN